MQKHKQELQEQQEKQQQQNQDAQARGEGEQGQGTSEQQQQRQQSEEAESNDTTPPPSQATTPGTARLTASVPSKPKGAARAPPPAAGGPARLAPAVPPKRPPPQKAPPNKAGAAQPSSLPSAAEQEKSRSLASGMLSVFKRDKNKDTLGLDASHSTQQYDAPADEKEPSPNKEKQVQKALKQARQVQPPKPAQLPTAAAKDKPKDKPSAATKPVQTPSSTLNTIVSLGGIMGSKDEGAGEDDDVHRAQGAQDDDGVPPFRVLRHEVSRRFAFAFLSFCVLIRLKAAEFVGRLHWV